MGRVRSSAISVSLIALAGCGGGGGSSGGTPSGGATPTPPVIATLNVSLSSPSASLAMAEGGKANTGFVATYSGTPSGAVVADVQIAGNRVALNGAPVASGNSYDVKLVTGDFPVGGLTATQVQFRLCTDAACGTVYPGSTQTFTVNTNVTLKDWATFQRDAAHTGYVAVKYDASKFPTAALWSVARDSNKPSAIGARTGSVYANFPGSSGSLVTRSINATSGLVQWSYDTGPNGYFSAPSYANGRVISATMNISSGTIPMQVLDASDGRVLRVLNYASQFARAGAPVPFDDKLYHQAGYYGNVVYGFNAAAGTEEWSRLAGSQLGGVSEGESVAVDAQYVYFYRADSLFILNRADGSTFKQIADPFFSSAGLSYFGTYYGAPILDGRGNIFTFSDNRGPTQPRPLIAFALSQPAFVWRTSNSYVGQPALRGNRLYAPRSGTTIVDVIDTATGAVTASIDVGTGKPNLTSNIVVTESHIFVGSDTETYAIDLNAAGNPVVWTVARGGDLAISPDNLLVISANAGVFAYKLI